MFTKYVDGLGKIKIGIFTRRNNLYVRIGGKTSRLGFTNGVPRKVGWATAIGSCDKFDVITKIWVYGDYTKPAKRFQLDTYRILTIKGIRKDLY